MGKASRSKQNRGKITPMRKDRDWFPIITSIAVVILIIAVGTFVVIGNMAQSAPAKAPASASINEETGAIMIGDGPTIVDEYMDFGCPHCGAWYEKSHEVITDLVSKDLATLNIYPIAILDNFFQGSKYSTRSASAAYCVAEANPDSAYGFVDLLFKNQPAEGSTGLEDSKLIDLAKQADAPKAESCITNGDYVDFVSEITQKTPVQDGAGGVSTPTVLVNGEFISVADPVEDTLVAAAKK